MAALQISKSFSVRSQIRENYDVFFVHDLTELLEKLASNQSNIFVIDKNVAEIFNNELKYILNECKNVVIEVDEHHKTMDYAQCIIRKLIKIDIRKDSTLVAIGGGITQDLVTFIASIFSRGIDWKFIPTTLLSQCDSCIGSKSSINFDQYKNLVGTFNPPSEIFICPAFLDTLTKEEIRSGLGEMLHYFFTEGIDIAQKVSDSFEELLTDRSLLPYFISNSLRIKKVIIEQDEFDRSIRHIFNYGHTFGHAIEAITKYSIPHGQAISIGMDLANYISLQKNILSEDNFAEMHAILIKNIPRFRITIDTLDEYCVALSKDKKNKGEMVGCILSRGPGKVEKIFIKMDQSFKDMILNYFNTFQS